MSWTTNPSNSCPQVPRRGLIITRLNTCLFDLLPLREQRLCRPGQFATSQSTDACQLSEKRETAVCSRLFTVPIGISRIPAISA